MLYKRLKRHVGFNDLKNNFFLICLSQILYLFFLSYKIFIIPLVIYLYYLYKSNRLLFKISIITILISFIIYLLYGLIPNYLNTSRTIETKALIYDVTKVEDSYILKAYSLKGKLILYSDNEIKIDSIINVTLKTLETQNARVSGLFNYKDYLNSNHVIARGDIKDYQIIAKIFTPYRIKEFTNTYLDKNFTPKTKAFIEALLFAKSSHLDSDVLQSIKTNGIIHLFAVSGLHIGLFISILTSFFSFLHIKNKTQNILIISFLTTYLFMTDFTPSISRVFIVYNLKNLNHRKNLRLSSLDMQSIAFLILTLLDSYKFQNSGLILSFFATFAIILTTNQFQSKTIITQILVSSLYTMAFTFPVTVNMVYNVNLLTPFVNIIFIWLTSSIVLPLTILTFVLPFVQGFSQSLIIGFQRLSVAISEIDIFIIKLPKFNGIMILIYYIVLLTLFYIFPRIKNSKKDKTIFRSLLSLILLFFIFIYANNGLNKPSEIHFLDLYNGESTVIFDKGNLVVVDTGAKGSDLSEFLKVKGVRKIDYLVITHSDSDHYGAMYEICEEFDVKNVIFNYYDSFNYGYFKADNVIYLKSGASFWAGKMKFECISPKVNNLDDNKNSLVLKFTHQNYEILLLGDIPKETELSLIEDDIKCDIIKIAHHGSKTSSSLEFIAKTKAKIAIIMAGRVKKYGFPHQETISTLSALGLKVYRTDKNYSISIINGIIKTLN